MHIVIASNFLNHHQLPLCRAFCAMPDVEFTFIATVPIEQERLQMGYADMDHAYEFCLCAYDGAENERKALEICRNCDILIVGSAPDRYVRVRNSKQKVTFFYSERLFKEKGLSLKTIPRWIKSVMKKPLYKNAYLLCASAFAAEDYAKTGNFKGRAFKWGYFPEVKHMDIDALMEKKVHDVPRLLWVGRMIDWKHPEAAIYVAKRLKEDGYDFNLDMIGGGEMKAVLQDSICEKNLQEQVQLLGTMPPEQVRECMEQSNIFLFTSDRGEGWGAVLNEAMNSGCAVVAANEIGSVPHLLKDGENGFIFQSENWDSLYEKVKTLLDSEELCRVCGHAAYQTMAETWNAETAARRLLELAEALKSEKEALYTDVPCSRI